MLLSRIFLIEFGMFVSAALVLLAWQVLRAWWPRRKPISVEDSVLLTGAVATCVALGWELMEARGNTVPAMPLGWVVSFGASCGFQVAMKAVRALKQH